MSAVLALCVLCYAVTTTIATVWRINITAGPTAIDAETMQSASDH